MPNNPLITDPGGGLKGALSGTRATHKAQKVCTLTEGDTTTTLSIRSGFLEQRGTTVHIKLVLEANVRGKCGATTTRSSSGSRATTDSMRHPMYVTVSATSSVSSRSAHSHSAQTSGVSDFAR